MLKYIGTKIVNMRPMTRVEYNIFRGWQLPTDENGEDAGYLVEYTDGGKPNTVQYAGYVSWSPKEQAELAYRETSGLPFGLAIEAMKKGFSIARSGWNGKGMFVYLVPANEYLVQTDAAKSHFGDGAMVPYNAYMAIKNVDGTVSTWVPSVNDCLSDDWSMTA
jgi:hypothetical protein